MNRKNEEARRRAMGAGDRSIQREIASGIREMVDAKGGREGMSLNTMLLISEGRVMVLPSTIFITLNP